MNDYLKKTIDFELNATQISQLEVFFELLVETNQKFNLTAITERQQVFEKHFIDSILGVVFLKESISVCDVGSGAGFPAIPLAIARPDLKITAVDSLNKRIGFLKEVCEKLNLSVRPVHSRAEDFGKGKDREKFDAVCARAVAPLNILLEYCAPLVKIGGTVLTYKTDESELSFCAHAESELGLVFKEKRYFKLPSGDSRCLLSFSKVRATPLIYPRGQNLARKKPL